MTLADETIEVCRFYRGGELVSVTHCHSPYDLGQNHVFFAYTVGADRWEWDSDRGDI